MSKPIPSMVLMNVSVETIDDCFQDMQKLRYGARVLIKTTDDESCDDPRFSDTCQNLFEENKVIMEDTCASPSCNEVGDDPFFPCFGCDDSTPRSSFDRRNGFQNGYEDESFEFKDRQSGETFKATRQSKRIICSRGNRTSRRCRLRASRAVEIRDMTYAQATQFVQAE